MILFFFLFLLPYVLPSCLRTSKFIRPIFMLIPFSYISYASSDIRFDVEFVRIRPTFSAPARPYTRSSIIASPGPLTRANCDPTATTAHLCTCVCAHTYIPAAMRVAQLIVDLYPREQWLSRSHKASREGELSVKRWSSAVSFFVLSSSSSFSSLSLSLFAQVPFVASRALDCKLLE